ncbi:hydrogenase formation protein HypD [Candidatus Macondimonas diazotrophica]|jgi:hydrogenase expression/formation protein HypD|uniref:Hydrogenase maturation factor n=1 Tax=Candidatus Macondimonas diazotrophica TaxID=2305248 RepID=A0A4Z0FA75_9GAMM|nr:hydrogenase formation protein HypD [Candidatus Macondimonas diazotrophica]NCU00409.1 hydrogenase formation protein HypD [Candidatus Macondimonas diazotrophica]TFZ82730.1 hydrogenase formation protein HypD [Candidatus Macondimonas diazotrophica]HBG31996.1 hydrogenase formation protein HypD [Gammaproteobacteria bacterium]
MNAAGVEADAIRRAVEDIAHRVSRPWTLMEVCGGQTHAILRHGLDRLLEPLGIELLHGPGCPVCVTPAAQIDQAIVLSRMPGVVLCSFGDMLRVPGTTEDLSMARARGGRVQVVYSPLDAVRLAEASPKDQVVFFAVGFETTAPATALAVRQAQALGLDNFSLLVAHVRVPPAVEVLLAAPDCRIQGLLAAGHVCTVMGLNEYAPLVARFGVPIVATGFEPLDLLEGVSCIIRQLEASQARLENAYGRAVAETGQTAARDLVEAVFEPATRPWRGLPPIPGGAWVLRPSWQSFDAYRRFAPGVPAEPAQTECLAGAVLTGRIQPIECPAYGHRCTPERPLGAPMVSAEGACAAYFQYRAPEGNA